MKVSKSKRNRQTAAAKNSSGRTWQRVKTQQTTSCNLPIRAITDARLLEVLRTRARRSLGSYPIPRERLFLVPPKLRIGTACEIELPSSAIAEGCEISKLLLSEHQGVIRLELFWEKHAIVDAASKPEIPLNTFPVKGSKRRKGDRRGAASLLPETAIFVTDRIKTHKVSGGLPSLGKRR
jgi:hypothetical protein